jgi:Domain of unknown function (DUF5753)
LLQTKFYTEALMRDAGLIAEEDIEKYAEKRLARSGVLFKQRPVELLAIIDEDALHRCAGSAAVMHRQLEYLLLAGERSNVSIRVIPQRIGVHAGIGGAFQTIESRDAPTVTYTDNQTSYLFMEEPREIEVYRRATRRLLDVSLDEGESAGLIADVVRELEKDPDVLPHFDPSMSPNE